MLPAELQSVKTANDEHMLIEGVATVTLTVGKRNVRHEIHVTPDLNELIIGSDWMAKQGMLTPSPTTKSALVTAMNGSLFTARST